ncbi:ankyrin repeat-containing protein [Anaeramoeba flamelloides]|uniref:Ankyrin repeat-containing protein n=1 Tax=Anaeramoeba flamelloides TaxID=1746091 RepID=A0AAV7Z245_9EUKA|nr:ankyrin repeat-containing protein [Anaeramoeba flamelloides]
METSNLEEILQSTNTQLIKKLIKKTDGTLYLGNGIPATLYCCMNSLTESLEFLLSSNQDPNSKCPLGNFALYHAAKKGNYEHVLLLLKYGADVDLTNGDGKCALDVAVTPKVQLKLLQEDRSIIGNFYQYYQKLNLYNPKNKTFIQLHNEILHFRFKSSDLINLLTIELENSNENEQESFIIWAYTDIMMIPKTKILEIIQNAKKKFTFEQNENFTNSNNKYKYNTLTPLFDDLFDVFYQKEGIRIILKEKKEEKERENGEKENEEKNGENENENDNKQEKKKNGIVYFIPEWILRARTYNFQNLYIKLPSEIKLHETSNLAYQLIRQFIILNNVNVKDTIDLSTAEQVIDLSVQWQIKHKELLKKLIDEKREKLDDPMESANLITDGLLLLVEQLENRLSKLELSKN